MAIDKGTVRGVIREHAIFDSEAHPIARATLSQHKSHNSHLIPGHVKLEFPEMDSEISLTFKGIETNPHLPDALWRIPDRNMQVVDLGDFIRSRTMMQRTSPFPVQGGSSGQPRAILQQPALEAPVQSAFGPNDTFFDGSPSGNSPFEQSAEREISEPEWDTPISYSRSADENGSFEQPPSTKPAARERKRSRFWPF